MLDFDAALKLLLGGVQAPEREQVVLDSANGRVLVEDLTAREPLPAFDYSAMDGYAVASADLAEGARGRLKVRGESRAGSAPSILTRGTCVRIFTGAPVPAGADAVVMQENTDRDGDLVTFRDGVSPGSHIRRRGEDLETGAIALRAGTRLNPFHLGLAAALNRAELVVAKRPSVGILCTGDELRPVGSEGPPGTIPESNSVVLRGIAEAAGGTVEVLTPAGDTLEETENHFAAALDQVRLLVTVGGVSVGDRDVVRQALENVGVDTIFHKVRIKPGKPIYYGRRGGTHVLGLPGNPVSAQVTFALFGVPLLRALQGSRDTMLTGRHATLTREWRGRSGRRGFYRVFLEGDRATVVDNQASGAAVSSAWANALWVVPEDVESVHAGATIEVIPYAEFS